MAEHSALNRKMEVRSFRRLFFISVAQLESAQHPSKLSVASSNLAGDTGLIAQSVSVPGLDPGDSGSCPDGAVTEASGRESSPLPPVLTFLHCFHGSAFFVFFHFHRKISAKIRLER